MKKIIFAALLALPALGLAISDASASWSICGQRSCTYQFHSPRVWFGFDCCAPGCPAPCAAPAAAQLPAGPAARPEAALAAPTTQPASYQLPATGYYAPAQQNAYAVPSYWYGR